MFWFKYDLGQKYQAPQVRPDWGSNSWPSDHNRTFHVTETPALTTWCSNHLVISDFLQRRLNWKISLLRHCMCCLLILSTLAWTWRLIWLEGMWTVPDVKHTELSGGISTLTVRNTGGSKLLCSSGHLDRSRWMSRQDHELTLKVLNFWTFT